MAFMALYGFAVLFAALQIRRQIFFERKLFHVKLHHLAAETWRTVVGGILGGLTASLAMLLPGAVFQPQAVGWIWAAALLLVLFRARFLCFAYAIGLVGCVYAGLQLFPGWSPDGWAGSWIDTLRGLDMPSLLFLVGVLHLVEAMLIRLQGTRMATPLFNMGKRGKIVGGYQLQGFWPLPLALPVPVESGGFELPWPSLLQWLGGDPASGGWMLLVLPAVVGFTESTQSMLPEQKAKITASRLAGYSVVVLAAAVLSAWLPAAVIAAALVSIALHEFLFHYSRREEEKRPPFFVHDDRGLKVLGVVPGSPAAALGILSGEIIHKVNGKTVRTKEQLHEAMRLNPAYCKLELLNRQNENKFLGRALYAGEHYQLGIILAPDQRTDYYVGTEKLSFLSLLKAKLGGLFSHNPDRTRDL